MRTKVPESGNSHGANVLCLELSLQGAKLQGNEKSIIRAKSVSQQSGVYRNRGYKVKDLDTCNSAAYVTKENNSNPLQTTADACIM